MKRAFAIYAMSILGGCLYHFAIRHEPDIIELATMAWWQFWMVLALACAGCFSHGDTQ